MEGKDDMWLIEEQFVGQYLVLQASCKGRNSLWRVVMMMIVMMMIMMMMMMMMMMMDD